MAKASVNYFRFYGHDSGPTLVANSWYRVFAATAGQSFRLGSQGGAPARAWMSEAHAGLSVSNGSIILHHVETESTLAMVATAVSK